MSNDDEQPVPTQHDYTISLNYVMERFNAEGIGRTKRRLAELCQKGILEGKKFKTTYGETWFVTEASLEAAIQQIKTEERLAAAAGDIRNFPAPAGSTPLMPARLDRFDGATQATARSTIAARHSKESDPADAGETRLEPAQLSTANEDDKEERTPAGRPVHDIFKHPYVVKLERRCDVLEQKLDEQTRRTETIQSDAFARLVELQRSSQIAQSKTLADFFIKTRDYLLGNRDATEQGTALPDGQT